MKVILDTHVLLWMFSRSTKLSRTARDVLTDADNTLLFSIAGYWEIGIKVSLGKLELAPGWEEAIPREITRNGITWLPIMPAHIHTVTTLPWVHRDPFDRLMIAQGIAEDAAIMSSDSCFSDYEVAVVW